MALSLTVLFEVGRTSGHPGLEIRPVLLGDHGRFSCRVEYQAQPTTTRTFDVFVISEYQAQPTTTLTLDVFVISEFCFVSMPTSNHH